MTELNRLPSLKQIIGALVFGANRPLSVSELRNCIRDVAMQDETVSVFAEVQPRQIHEALDELKRDLSREQVGFSICEVAGGFRLQSDASCGRWLKHLLKARPQRLSQPALETMAIIAYRQPISKSDIESIRGVSVAHIIKGLMEMQLVRIAGRSELPGRPFLYGTTHLFLEHFGLKNLKELDRMGPRVFAKKEQKEEKDPSEQEPLFENSDEWSLGDPAEKDLSIKEPDPDSVEENNNV